MAKDRRPLTENNFLNRAPAFNYVKPFTDPSDLAGRGLPLDRPVLRPIAAGYDDIAVLGHDLRGPRPLTLSL